MKQKNVVNFKQMSQNFTKRERPILHYEMVQKRRGLESPHKAYEIVAGVFL